MRRTLEQAFDTLRAQVKAWASGQARPDLRVFVYPPEWEAAVLAHWAHFAEECASQGHPVELEDVGQGFLTDIKRRHNLIDRLETVNRDEMLHDLGYLASSYLRRALSQPLQRPAVCRILTNTGSIAAFTSYSALANELAGTESETEIPATVIAFPGEGDDRSLNMLRLRVDTNYRVPRV